MKPVRHHNGTRYFTRRYLAGLDRANQRALDLDDPESARLPPPPPIGQRLEDGFALIALAGDDDGEDN